MEMALVGPLLAQLAPVLTCRSSEMEAADSLKADGPSMPDKVYACNRSQPSWECMGIWYWQWVAKMVKGWWYHSPSSLVE